MPRKPRVSPLCRQSGNAVPALLGIFAIVAVIALAFAWVAGWLSPSRVTAQSMVNTLQKANGQIYAGYRRAHSKGICVSGSFASNGQGAALSKAAIFAAGTTVPVLGRMSIGVGMPEAPDSKGRVRSMALQLKTADGQEWRTAMNSFPFFVVSTPQAFNDLNIASVADPATGKPDPAKMAAWAKAHPEAAPFFEWAKTAPFSTSFASTTYNGVDSFRFVDAGGTGRFVRWSMLPKAPFEAIPPDTLKDTDPNFLDQDLVKRLADGPLTWDMEVTVAKDGDPIVDPSKPWPEDRQKLVVGTLTLDHAEPQATGACRDINFDPLVLPTGIEGSDDPVLAARSAVYSVSFNRREQEIGAGKAPEATGQKADAAAGAKP